MKILWAAILSLSSCASVNLGSEKGGDSKTVHFGFVVVGVEETEQTPRLVEYSTLGGWIGLNSLGVGYKRFQQLFISRECRVVFLIENPEQLAASVDLVSSTLDASKGDICVIGS